MIHIFRCLFIIIPIHVYTADTKAVVFGAFFYSFFFFLKAMKNMMYMYWDMLNGGKENEEAIST
jgi:hypothetical protein